MAIQYYVSSMDSSKDQIFTGFYTFKGINVNAPKGPYGLTDFINLSVAETGHYTIAAKQGWINKFNVPSSIRSSVSAENRTVDGVEQYYLTMNDNSEYWVDRYGRAIDTAPGEKHMLPAIALYTSSENLTGDKLLTQRSSTFISGRNRHPIGEPDCIGQGLPLMEKDRNSIPFNYYLNYDGWETLSSIPVDLRDFSFGESRNFVYLSAGQTYTLLATQVSTRGSRFNPSNYSTGDNEVYNAMHRSLTASGNYYIEVNKLAHVTNPGLSTTGAGLYFSDGTGTEAITDLNYFRSAESDTLSSGLYTRRSTYLTNMDNYVSAADLFDVYYNKWSIEYDLDESNRYGIPLQFNLVAGGLYFGKWLSWVGQGSPATTECDFIIIRKSDRKTIRVQGELSYANYQSLSCTDVSNVVNSPNQQRLRNLGYF